LKGIPEDLAVELATFGRLANDRTKTCHEQNLYISGTLHGIPRRLAVIDSHIKASDITIRPFDFLFGFIEDLTTWLPSPSSTVGQRIDSHQGHAANSVRRRIGRTISRRRDPLRANTFAMRPSVAGIA